MNTEKTLLKKFNKFNDYPIWYYKEIKEVDISYVVYNLLKETFVVEIENKKIEITFGKNNLDEIGTTQSSDEGLDYTSYETINKAFKEGTWFVITDIDTTEDFKSNYIKDKEETQKKEERDFMIDMLNRAIELSNVDDKIKEAHYSNIKTMDNDKLKELTDLLFSSFKKQYN